MRCLLLLAILVTSAVAQRVCPERACQNGGMCMTGRCVCMRGWTGQTCETALDFCQFPLCLNGGVCSNIPGGYRCDCPDPFYGVNCENCPPKLIQPPAASRFISAEDNAIRVCTFLGKVAPPPIGSTELSFDNNKWDIVLLLDGSGSIGLPDFKIELSLAAAFATAINGVNPIGPDLTRVGAVQFSDAQQIVVEFDLGIHDNVNDVRDAFLAIGYDDSTTCIALALQKARDILLTRGRSNVKQLVILLTDGEENCGGDVCAAAEEVKQLGAEIFVWGIGAFREDQVACIASSEDASAKSLDFSDALKTINADAITSGCQAL